MNFNFNLGHTRTWFETGPDLRGRGPGPQASHQQRASHQTRHILFVVHATKLTHYHWLQKTEDVLILNP